jgi:hypothetical protein
MFGLRLRGQWLVPIILGMASQVLPVRCVEWAATGQPQFIS